MDASIGMSANTYHLIINLPNGSQLEHKTVPTSESLWNILLQFESQFNHNLCGKYNKENRYELPQLLYNNYPFASTLKQLLSSKLTDITKHRKPNKSSKDAIELTLIFKPQAFSINELKTRISKIDKELKKQEKSNDASMDIDNKDDMDDVDDNNKKTSGLDADFAMDIDPIQAQSTEEIFRKMEMLLYKLTKLLTTKEEFIGCMKLLKKVVNNLVIHPLDKPDDKKNKDPSKYRKLNLNNDKLQKSLFKYEPVLDILLLIGFIKKSNSNTESYLILPPENENNVVFQALIVKISNSQPPKQAIPEIDKDIKIYLLDDVRKFKEEEARLIAQRNANNNNQSDVSLASQHRKASKNLYQKHHPTKLMGKELREKMYGIKQKEYKFTVIRIEFPSKYVLEAKFHPNTAIYKLFQFVHSFLDQQILKLKYQLLLPPHDIIKNKNDENQTFKSLGGMIPASTIRFVLDPKKNKNVNYNDNYIRNEFIQKYFTKNVTSLRLEKLNSSMNDSGDGHGDDEEKKQENNEKKKKSVKNQLAALEAEKARRRLQAKLAKLNRK